jgi:hypothetical protein
MLVFTGIATEFGIESSARDAFNRGFYSVVISDCVSSPYKDGHDRSLENMKNLITIINSKELGNIWVKLEAFYVKNLEAILQMNNDGCYSYKCNSKNTTKLHDF